MLSARLIQLIEAHSDALTREAMRDIATNKRTESFRQVPKAELERRISALYHNLGKWIADPDDDAVRREYEEWGGLRFRQGIPLSEMVYCVILIKTHLRRYIREHGLVDFAGDRATPDLMLPMALYGVEELNSMVGEFFDRALYHLARGYEAEAQRAAY